MGKVEKYIFSKEIASEPDENANRLQLELSHDGYHLHYRNLRIRIPRNEISMWKRAFEYAEPLVRKQNLL